MNTMHLEALCRRLHPVALDLRETVRRAAEAYVDDPLFCVPAAARAVVAEYGQGAEVILLGTSWFSRTFLKEAAGRVRVAAAVDDFRAPHGEQFEGLPIITSQELAARAGSGRLVAVDGSRGDHARRYFKNLTRRHGIPSLNYEQALRLWRIHPGTDHRVEDWAPAIAAHLPRFLALADRLVDDHSRHTLCSVLLHQLTCNREWMLHAARPYSTLYFRSGLWAPSLHERFVDCGASIAESSAALIDATDGRFDRIWMIEPDRFNVETLQRFIAGFSGTPQAERFRLHACALGSAPARLPFLHQGGHGGQLGGDGLEAAVDVCRLDDLLDAEPTLIKMDIEGAELEALRGGRNAIVDSRPALAISAYHRATDLVDISDYVLSLHPDYRVGLRHHTEERWDTCLYFF